MSTVYQWGRCAHTPSLSSLFLAVTCTGRSQKRAPGLLTPLLRHARPAQPMYWCAPCWAGCTRQPRPSTRPRPVSSTSPRSALPPQPAPVAADHFASAWVITWRLVHSAGGGPSCVQCRGRGRCAALERVAGREAHNSCRATARGGRGADARRAARHQVRRRAARRHALLDPAGPASSPKRGENNNNNSC